MEGGGRGGASAPGPGPVVGARAKLDFFFFIGSPWGIQDFDKGGGPPKKKFGQCGLQFFMI